MIGAADHFLVGDGFGGADFFERVDDVRGGLGGGVGVDEFFGDGDFAAVAEVFDVAADGLHDGFAAGGVGVADVELESDAAGDAVDGAGMDVAGADGGDGVDGAGGEGVAFDGEDDFGGGAEGVAAVGHEERAGVAAEAFDGEAIARRARRCW